MTEVKLKQYTWNLIGEKVGNVLEFTDTEKDILDTILLHRY